ncbi:MAG TPA: hypothetical protein VH814_05165 [Steroidobacteraceae bacterium]|jgi:hypothetical protein
MSSLERFLRTKMRSLKSRSRRLVALTPETVGLRQQDLPFAPSAAHFAAANRRLAAIGRSIDERLKQAAQLGPQASIDSRLVAMAMVEREVDRARRAFGMFFEVFEQRGTAFAPALEAHDAIARDCYAVIAKSAPGTLSPQLLSPVTYNQDGYSPATSRREVALSRLLGETNPFPLIRIPWDRDQPWQAVFVHEVAHNVQSDLGLWVENREAVIARLATERIAPVAIGIFGRWHKEVFADLCAVLLGGPAVAWGLAEFLAHPHDKVMTYRPGGPHPTGYLRVLILAELLRRMGFADDGSQLAAVWQKLYPLKRGHRMPAAVLSEAPRAIPAVVDEIVYQARRALSERSLARLIPFTAADQARIRAGGRALVAGRMPADLPARFLVSACRYAIEAGVDVAQMSAAVTARLAKREAAAPDTVVPIEVFPKLRAA